MKVVTGIKFLAVVGAVALATASVRANLIVNPGFEQDPILLTGWSLNYSSGSAQITTGAGNVHSGSRAALLMVTGQGAFTWVVVRTGEVGDGPNIPVTLDNQYLVTFWLKALSTASTHASVKVKGDVSSLPVFYPTDTWSQYSYLTSQLSDNPTELSFEFTGPMGTQFYFDDVYFAPVPEPGTLVAGALLLLPLGVRAFRMLRKSREGRV